MDNFKLNDGNEIPAVGFGVFMNGAGTEENVQQALAAGYRSIDTAVIYRNERLVGRGLKLSGIAREEVFITTKLWPSSYPLKKGLRILRESLERLQLESVDMVLLHRPHGKVREAWQMLEHAQELGLVKSIGVSNFIEEDLDKLLSYSMVKPAVNQLELHPYWQQRKLREYMSAEEILPEAWYPLGHGSKELLSEPTLLELAKAYGKTVAQLILRWHLQSGIRPLPKSSNEARIRENLALDDFELSSEAMSSIDKLERSKALGEPRWLSKIASRLPTPPQLN